MLHSEIYLALESQIEKRLVAQNLSELNQQLERLAQEGRITRDEYRSLIELFIKNQRLKPGFER